MKMQSKISPERRFKCNECEKTFTRKQNLSNHIFTHTGYKQKLQCPTCNKLFINLTNIRVHFKSFHRELNAKVLEKKAVWVDIDSDEPEKRFICEMQTTKNEICGKMFTRKEKLNYHMQNYHTVSPSKLILYCVHGRLTFASKSNLIKHMADYHNSKLIMMREMQRQVVLDRQNGKTQNKVLPLLTGHPTLLKSSTATSKMRATCPSMVDAAAAEAGSSSSSGTDMNNIISGESGNLTPSVSIAPINSSRKKPTTRTFDSVASDIASRSIEPCEIDLNSDEKFNQLDESDPLDDLMIVDEDSEEEDKDDNVVELKIKPLDIVEIKNSSDDDSIVLDDNTDAKFDPECHETKILPYRLYDHRYKRSACKIQFLANLGLISSISIRN